MIHYIPHNFERSRRANDVHGLIGGFLTRVVVADSVLRIVSTTLHFDDLASAVGDIVRATADGTIFNAITLLVRLRLDHCENS